METKNNMRKTAPLHTTPPDQEPQEIVPNFMRSQCNHRQCNIM